MRILFMGTPDIAAECLKALYAAGHDICAVYTRRDKPVGRKQVLTAPPVKEVALAHGTPVFQPRTLRDGSEDENTGREKKQLFRESDSKAFTAMMSAFADKSASRNYRDTVTAKCRELLTAIVRPALAVRYVVALGRRDLLWELLPEYIEKNVLEVRDD